MKFEIGFEKEDKKKLFEYWNEILDANVWSEGKFTKKFEENWSIYNYKKSLSFSSWSGAAESVIKYYNLENETVLCPSNTFQATPMISKLNKVKIKFVYCNKNFLCVSLEDIKKKVDLYKPKAIWVVHIGGHIAFQINEISDYCKKNKIILIEDCAHAHGASYNGKRAGSWGNAGIYSFYATKTISTGEGGLLVSDDNNLIEFAKEYRNYGKPENVISGKNFRMSEFTAALGCIQVARLDDIVEWKNNYFIKEISKYTNYLKIPKNMISGHYKFIIFEEIKNSVGKVYETGCHKIFNEDVELPNTDWANKNHWCVPLFYKGEEI